jgi:hypothetical protein
MRWRLIERKNGVTMTLAARILSSSDVNRICLGSFPWVAEAGLFFVGLFLRVLGRGWMAAPFQNITLLLRFRGRN